MQHVLVRRALALMVVFLTSPLAMAAAEPGKQTSEKYEADGKSLGYLLYTPADYGKEAGKKWPVILFLHGSGERGNGADELEKVAKHGPPKLAEKEKLPFIVISPQCPKEARWDPKQLKGLLESVQRDLKSADPDRVYLTGLSMGGFGSWAMAAEYPTLFAAIAPICGGGNPANAAKLKDLPIWVFHGEKDTAVKIQQSEAMVAALKAAGAKEVEFTRYPNLAHDSWTETYANPKLYEWFLSHARKSK